jgi:hypothetical protein
MDGEMDRGMDERMEEQMDGGMDANRWINEGPGGRMDRELEEQVAKYG